MQAEVGDGLHAVAQLAASLAPADGISCNESTASTEVHLPPHHAAPHQQREQKQQQQQRCEDEQQQNNEEQQQHQQQQQQQHQQQHQQQQSDEGQQQQHQRPVDVLIIDAGSGDASVPMSCPPPAFLEPAFLQQAKQVLSSAGMLVVNCVSRATQPYKDAIKALQVS